MVVFVRKGGITIGKDSKAVGPQGVALLARDGTSVQIDSTEANTQVCYDWRVSVKDDQNALLFTPIESGFCTTDRIHACI